MRTGRPTLYSDEMVDKICAHVSDGGWIEECDKMDGYPCSSTIYAWLLKYTDFSDKYVRAVEIRAHRFAYQALQIAYDDSKDIYVTPEGETRVSHANVQRSKLQVDTLKFIASKHCSKVYGDRVYQEVQGKLEGGMVVPSITIVSSAPAGLPEPLDAIEYNEDED